MSIMCVDWIHVWLQGHVLWLGSVIALVACLESLVAIGFLLPGSVMLFVLSVLAGVNTTGIYLMLACGAVGAIIGDGVSFLLGRRYHGKLQIWRQYA